MTRNERIRYICWGSGLGVAIIFVIISFIISSVNNGEILKKTILINAPENMVGAFESAFEVLELDEDYKIEYTEDISKANFIVKEGIENQEGELIAYSPIIGVINADEKFKEKLIETGTLVESNLYSENEVTQYDLNFKKIIDEILSEKGSNFKIYYPGKETDTWNEFYHYLLFAVNDGIYPKTDEEHKKANEIINAFVNSKNAIAISDNALEKANSISKDTIYFMPYSDFYINYRKSDAEYVCRIIYPTVVVNHGFYATYDEIGKIVYEALTADKNGFFKSITDAGYAYLRNRGYNTHYSKFVSTFNSDYVLGIREKYNIVEIPISNRK